MSAAAELIEAVKANGGQLRVEDGYLVIAPKEAAAPVLEDLRRHKAEIIGLLSHADAPRVDAGPWGEDFKRWARERCAARKRHSDAGGIGYLLLDFAQWATRNNSIPCDRKTFEALLTDSGFRCVDGLALGLVLRDDLQAVLQSQIQPSASRSRRLLQ
jgi:hypothetical protein